MSDPSFQLTRNQIIIDALSMIGVIDTGEQPAVNEVQLAERRLNSLINEIAPFLDVLSKKDTEHTLTPGTKSYTVYKGGDIDIYRPYTLVYARRKNSTSGREIMIDVELQEEYINLPEKSTQAPPNLVYYDPGVTQGTLYVWPTGDSTWDTLVLTFTGPRNTLDDVSDTLDLPQEWHSTIEILLAEALAPDFLGGMPRWLIAKAREKRIMLQGHDAADSFIFKPDLRR